jgi:NAD(P)-dependent dehydrogenase (short-subunit alcohol dehydrogenase family)
MTKKLALITGANRGLGLETARQLSAKGYKLLLTARNLSSLDSIELPHSIKMKLDVSNPVEVENFLKELAEKKLFIDVLINNAGVCFDGRAQFALEAELVDQTISTNFTGAYILCQGLIPGMLERNYGRIVNVSSHSGSVKQFEPNFPVYRISKLALNAMTILFAQFVSEKNSDVLINSVCPGLVNTDMGGKHAPISVEEGAEAIVWAATMFSHGPNGKIFYGKTEGDRL